MFLIANSFSCTLILVLAIFKADANPAKWRSHVKETESCVYKKGYPNGTCQLPENCLTLPKYIELNLLTRDELFQCGFRDATVSMMYCCPYDMPESNKVPESKLFPSPPVKNGTINFRHLTSMRYYISTTFDDYVYRSTAIILTPNYILATVKSVGNEIKDIPNAVLFGVPDLKEYSEEIFEIEIKNTTKFKDDLVIFELDTSINENPLSTHVNKATLCDESDLIGDPKLYAVGYAQNASINCGLFRQQLRLQSLQDCRNVQNKRNVQDIHTPNTHLCVAPVSGYSPVGGSSGCLNCLTASSSVLHVERTDGSFCVAGIATPTTDECFVDNNPLYYTSVMSIVANDFFNEVVFRPSVCIQMRR